MLMEVAIITSSVIAGFTAISLYAISFAKKLHISALDVDKAQLTIEQSELDAQIALAKQKQDFEISKEKEEYRKLNPLPPTPPKPKREETLLIVKGQSYVLRTCPHCMKDNSNATRIPSGNYCHNRISDCGNTKVLGNITFSKGIVHGPSSPVSLTVNNKHYLWQCCIYCYGEWLVDTGLNDVKPNVPKKSK